MKQSKRFLAVLLAMIMTLSLFTVGVSAYKTDYREPAGRDSILDPYFTNDQAASAFMDLLDGLFASMDVEEHILSLDIVIKNFDSLCNTIDDVQSYWLYGAADFIIDLGNIEDLNTDFLRNHNNRRSNGSMSDFQLFTGVCNWLAIDDNADVVAGILDGSFTLGNLLDGVAFDLYEEVPLLNNIHGYVCNMLYELLFTDGEPSGYVEGAPDNYVLDDMVQDFLNNHLASFIFGLLDDDAFATVNEYVTIPLHKNEAGKYVDVNGNDMGLLGLLPSLKPADISITATSTYDLIINIVNALVDDILVPYGGKIILDLLEIDPEDPTEDTSYIDIAINLFVDYAYLVEKGVVSADTPEESVNTIEEFLRWKGVENPDQPKPIDKTSVALEFILKEGITRFIHFEGTPGVDSHLQLTPYFSGMFSGLIKTVVPMLPSLVDDFTPLTAEQEAAIQTMEDEELFAFLLRMVLEAFVDGVYFPEDNCDTIRKLATYTLINLTEELIHDPNVDFQKMVDEGTLDPDSDACLDIAAAVINYFVVGETTFESANKMPTFEQLANDCFETFLGKYVTLFSMYPNASDKVTYANNPWYKLFMSANQWIPLTNIIYGVEDSWQGMKALLMDSIIGNVLDFDINGILGIIGRRPDSDLNKPLSQVLSDLIARILNGVFKLPIEAASQPTQSFQVNNLIVPYEYTRLDQVLTTKVTSSTPGYNEAPNGCLNGTGLKNTARMLLKSLPNITQPGAVAAESLDIIAELVGVIDLDLFEFMPYTHEHDQNAQLYSINDLKTLYNELRIPSNDGIKYYDPNYTYCEKVDFEPWTFKEFESALEDAESIIAAYDSGESVKRADISYAYYALDHWYNDYLLANQPAAEIYYLKKIMNNNARIAANDDGTGNIKYTNRSWDDYVKAYDFAQLVETEYNQFKNQGRLGDYKQSKVNTARSQLREAIYGLKLNAGLGDADYSNLYNALSNLQYLSSPAVFTDKSVQAVVDAYNAALAFYNEVWYDADYQEVVDGITEKLTKAYDLLVNVPRLAYYDEGLVFLNTDEVNSYIYGLFEPFYTEQQAIDYGDDFTYYMNDWFVCYGAKDEFSLNMNFIPTANGHGTGSKVELLSDEDGDGLFTKEREYTIIYFGDVNGDGNADGQDAVILKCFAARMLSANANNTAITFAGDVDCDDILSTVDATNLDKAGVFKYEVDQAPSARADNTITFADLVAGTVA